MSAPKLEIFLISAACSLIYLQSAQASALSDAAAALTPGQWTEFTAAENASWANGSMMSDQAGTTGNITDWSSKMNWNPVNNTMYYLGGSHCGNGETGCPNAMVLVAYSEGTNTWTHASFPTGTHTYELNTINTATGSANKLYHRVYNGNTVNTIDLASMTFGSNLPNIPANGQDCCSGLEYFPDRNSIISLDDDWGIYEYSFATGQWGSCLFNTTGTLCGAPANKLVTLDPSSTVAPWGRYDSVNHRLLLGGGTNVYALSSTLTLTKLASAPFPLGPAESAASGQAIAPVTIDPGTGKLVAIDSSANTYVSDGTSWTKQGGSPFTNPPGTGFACGPISNYNIIMCVWAGNNDQVTNGKVWLYKLSSAVPPPPPPPPPSNACDVTGDGLVNVADVQKEVNMYLQVIPCANPSGTCTVASVQRVVNAALGGVCIAP